MIDFEHFDWKDAAMRGGLVGFTQESMRDEERYRSMVAKAFPQDLDVISVKDIEAALYVFSKVPSKQCHFKFVSFDYHHIS